MTCEDLAMKMKRCLSLAVCAALLAALCACGSVSQDKLESVMDKYVADGNPQRAAQLAETWLSQQKESDYSHAYLYEKLADLYENDLSAPDEALATLQKGYEATGSSDLLDRLIQTATGNSLNQLAGVFPTSEELVLEGRPFAQWTGEELQAWLPVTEDSYNDNDNDNSTEEWYRVEYFKNENVTISRDQLSGSSTLRVEFDNLGGWDNSYLQEGPEPTLPRGIAVGDDLTVVLEKLGVPETIVPYLADASSIYFDVTGSGAQKRYEDKIKAKKKAEMDAKKALIRAEDMKKGVFSTIGQLPKEEPRKGSIAASAAV